MQTLHIRKFKARYRLPASSRDERHRLDAALKMAMDTTLESEITRLGFYEGEEVCIRAIFVPVRLRLSATVEALAKAWGAALAEAIRRTIGVGRVAGIVRYESRFQGLVDMAVGIALDDLERAWAWRQLGLWRAGERASQTEALRELVRALVAEPTTIVPLISTLSDSGALKLYGSRVLELLAREHWQALAGAALNVAGVPGLLNQSTIAPSTKVAAATMREASRLIATSRLARAKVATRAHLSARDVEVQRAVAALIILESAQSALLRGETEARSLINAVMLALNSPPAARSLRRAEGEGVQEARPAIAGLSERASTEFDKRPEVCANDELEDVSLTRPNASTAAGASEHETLIEIGGQKKIFDAASSDDERPLPVVRRRDFTRFGGLLFLTGLMEDLCLPEEMSAYAALCERPFRWLLHRLALELTHAAESDAAALAFAGLLPDAAPPSRGEDEPSDSEADVIASYASRITEELRVRLEEWRDEPPTLLLQRVCRRRAEIIADPGWFEVRLSLDEVETVIRRAGLDLDPGYLRWLGVVVKFVYE